MGGVGTRTGAGAGDSPASRGPRAEQDERAGDKPVLRDTFRLTGTDGRRVGAEQAPGASGQQLELPLDGATDELGDADLRRRRGSNDDASELRAALDELAILLVGPSREADQANGDQTSGGRDARADHERAAETAVDLDDVVRRLLGIGGADSMPQPTSSPDEPRLDELGGLKAGGEAQHLPRGSTKVVGEQAPTGRASEPGWTCDGTNLGIVPCCGGGDSGRVFDLGPQTAPCGGNAFESPVVEAHAEDPADLWRDPTPRVVDFRVQLAVNTLEFVEYSLDGARRSGRAGADAAAPRLSGPPPSLSELRGLGVVVRAERQSGRCLSLLGPRGPPLERAPQAPRCGRDEGRDRKAEADRRRACEATPGHRGPNTPIPLSSGPSDPHSSCSRPRSRVGSTVSSPLWSPLVGPLHVGDVHAALAGGLFLPHRRPTRR